MDIEDLAGPALVVSGITIAALTVALVHKNNQVTFWKKRFNHASNFGQVAARIALDYMDQFPGEAKITKKTETSINAFKIMKENDML